MSAVINTNLASLFAQNALNNAQGNLATSVQRLSSGLRINSAKDDASGLAISQTMAGHIKALDQSSLNAQQAVNLAQTADTSLSTTQDILLRMQQLAVEGTNGSLSNSQRSAIVTELTNLNTQINGFAQGTTYNGISLLGASTSQDTTPSGTLVNGLTVGTGSINNINVSSANASSLFKITNPSGSQLTLTRFDSTDTNYLTPLSSQTVSLTATMGASGSQTVNFSELGVSFNLSAPSATTGATTAAALAALNTNNAFFATAAASSSSTTLTFQVGANPSTYSGDQIQLSTININTGVNGTVSQMTQVGTDIGTTLYALTTAANPTDQEWSDAFKGLQNDTRSALDYVSGQRAILGSNMNQLGYINSNLVAQSANEQAARSTVVDTNYSAETSQLTKGQIMQQAATAMLAQANQMPNVILSLLK